MKRLLPHILLLGLLIIPQIALADVNVQISGNGPGAKSEVSIENNINSKTTTTQKSTGKTDIRIETNGEVKEYHSEGNESVYLESGNGNNSVSIQTGGSVVDLTEITSSSSATASAEIKAEKENESFNIVEFIKKQFDSVLNIFLN